MKIKPESIEAVQRTEIRTSRGAASQFTERAIHFQTDGDSVTLAMEDFAALANSNAAAVCEIERLTRKLRWYYVASIWVLAGAAAWLIGSVLRG